MEQTNVNKRLLAPVLMGFFIMGFCDLVAPITARIAAGFPAERQAAVNFLPTMVFLWFLLLSVPIAGLMNRIGRKATVIIGDLLTFVGLMIPYLAGRQCDLVWYFVGFGILGIGNTAIQVAINPLLAAIVPGERMTSYLTVGQIFRNTSLLLLAPLVLLLSYAFDDWRLLLPIYGVVTLVGIVWLWRTPVADTGTSGGGTIGMGDCFRLLGNSTVALCAVGVGCFIAADIGVGFLSARLIDNPNSILTSTGYYACRIVGTLIGAWVLLHISDVKYLRANMSVALVLVALLFFARSSALIYPIVGVLGFTLACVFATLFAVATKAAPGKGNEVSGLMIMAIAAGAVSSPVIGALIRAFGEVRYGVLFVLLCIGYLVWASCRIGTKK